MKAAFKQLDGRGFSADMSTYLQTWILPLAGVTLLAFVEMSATGDDALSKLFMYRIALGSLLGGGIIALITGLLGLIGRRQDQGLLLFLAGFSFFALILLTRLEIGLFSQAYFS